MSTEGNDILSAIADGELIDGLGGDDQITSDFNDTTLIGGFGDDRITTILDRDPDNEFFGTITQSGDAGDDVLIATVTFGAAVGSVIVTNNLDGGTGDDSLTASISGIGADSPQNLLNMIDGGDGDDVIDAFAESAFFGFDSDARNSIFGGRGDDDITADARSISNGAGPAVNFIDAGAGDDIVNASASTNSNDDGPLNRIEVLGGSGDDEITTSQGTGDDGDPVLETTILAGSGADIVDASVFAGGEFSTQVDFLVDGGSGDDELTALISIDPLGNGATITAEMQGGSGSDILSSEITSGGSFSTSSDITSRNYGGFGDDILDSTITATSEENDTVAVLSELFGGQGSDVISSSVSVETEGADATARNSVVDTNGDNSIALAAIGRVLGSGTQVLNILQNDVQTGRGDDDISVSIMFDGGIDTSVDATNTILSGGGDDIIFAEIEQETANVLNDNQTLSNVIDSGSGDDQITARATSAFPGSVALLVSNSIVAGSGDDVIDASVSAGTAGVNLALNEIDAGQGDDFVTASMTTGTNSSDPTARTIVHGRNGNDVLISEMTSIGDETPIFDAQLFGGNGSDELASTITVGGPTVQSVETLLNGGRGDDILTSVINADTDQSSTHINTLEGENGDDVLIASISAFTTFDLDPGTGSNFLDGGRGDDELTATIDQNTLGASTLTGGRGNDVLTAIGGDGNVLDGGHDDDEMTGGVGADAFLGGSGADTVILLAGFGIDSWLDLDVGDGDQLDVSALAVDTSDVTVVVNGDGTQTLLFPGGDALTVPGGTVNLSSPGATEASLVALGIPSGGGVVNQPPQANDDSATVTEGNSVIIDVLVNDVDPDGDQIDLIDPGVAANGTILENPDGTLTYTPDTGFFGTDQFIYTISDGVGAIDSATVTVDVEQAPAGPVPVFEAVLGGQAFDGSNGDVINLTPGESLAVNLAEGTIAFAFETPNAGERGGLYTKDASGFSGGGNHVAIYHDNDRILARVQDGANSETLRSGVIADNQTYEVALTFGASGFSLFVDGSLADSSTAFGADLTTNQEFLQIGGLGWGSATGQGTFGDAFEGTIADVQVFDQILSVDDILALA